MPNLPTVELTQDQYDLVMEMFNGQYGSPGQPATVEDAYIAWNRRALRGQIQNKQFGEISQQYNADLEAATMQAIADLEVTWPSE